VYFRDIWEIDVLWTREEFVGNVFWTLVGRKCRCIANAGFRVEQGHSARVCRCTGTTANISLARTCWSPVTTLCRFQYSMAEVCALPSAL